MKRLMVLAVLGLGLVASTVWAQEQSADQAQRRGQRGMRGVGNVEQAVTLTAEQKEKVTALREKLTEQMRTQMGQPDQSAMDKMRELRQQLTEAAKAGDDAKVEKLQKELNETGTMAERRKLVAGYYDQVEKILTPEQKKPFEAWRKLQDSGVPASLLASPEELKTALKKVELSDAQQKKIDAAFARYEKPGTSLPADKAEAHKQAKTQELAAEVVATLKPSQKVLLSDAAGGQRRARQG